jgi:hypothetical protein
LLIPGDQPVGWPGPSSRGSAQEVPQPPHAGRLAFESVVESWFDFTGSESLGLCRKIVG